MVLDNLSSSLSEYIILTRYIILKLGYAVCGQHLFRCMFLLGKLILVSKIWEQFLLEDLRLIILVARFQLNSCIWKDYTNCLFLNL